MLHINDLSSNITNHLELSDSDIRQHHGVPQRQFIECQQYLTDEKIELGTNGEIADFDWGQ